MRKLYFAAMALAMVPGSALAQDVITYVSPSQGSQDQARVMPLSTSQPLPIQHVSPTFYPSTQDYVEVYPRVWPQPMPVVQPGTVVYPNSGSVFTPGYVPPTVYPTPIHNPVVGYIPPTVTNIMYDQFGNPIVSSQSNTMLQSAFDPLRNTAIAGTTRPVDRHEFDQYGRYVHVTGSEWLGADGVWHGNLNRQTITQGSNGVIHNQNDVLSYGNKR